MNDPKLELIFHAAKELGSPEQRDIYLRDACKDQPELRNQVEALLRAAAEADALIQTENHEGETQLTDAELSEGPGSRIARYKLLQKLGEGGMGVVYMAEQTEPVKRKVALKIIKLGMDTRQVVARFEAERQALAMMDHPNIAKVLDAGATDTGRPYFVMELVRGVPITEYCDKNKLGTEQRLTLFMDVCRAIHHAHQKGVIHRDIKPSNVMVTLHDGNPVPKVIDFGIAKATNHNLTEKTLFTNYSQMIGTPAYMSPEQAEMSGLDVDTRTDVYSLGVLLYELLTGTTPFPSKELLSLGYGEMQKVITEQEPPKPSTRVQTMQNEQRTTVARNRALPEARIEDSLRGDLDWIVMKSLEKDRTQRYETVNALEMDVTHFLNDEPVTAAAPTLRYQLKKLYQRNRNLVHTSVLVGLLLIVATVFSSFLAIRANHMSILAEDQRDKADALRLSEVKLRESAETNLRQSLMGQAEAWLKSHGEGYQTNVWNAVLAAKALPGSESDTLKLRNLAWASVAAPFRREWQTGVNQILNPEQLTSLDHSDNHFAFGYQNGSIEIVSLQTGEQTRKLDISSTEAIVGLLYHPTQNVWIACNTAGRIGVWHEEGKTPSPHHSFDSGLSVCNRPFDLVATEQGFALFSYPEKTFWLWSDLYQVESKRSHIDITFHQNQGDFSFSWGTSLNHSPVAIHPNGNTAAIVHQTPSAQDTMVSIWDLGTSSQITEFLAEPGDSLTPHSVKFSANGSHLLVTDTRYAILVRTHPWGIETRQRGESVGYSDHFDISPDGRHLACGGSGISIVDIANEQTIFTDYDFIGAARFRRTSTTLNGLYLAQNPPRWWAGRYILGQAPERSVLTMSWLPVGAAFSPDSKQIATTSVRGNPIAICDLAHPDQIIEASRDGRNRLIVEDPAFSRDGDIVAHPFSNIHDKTGFQFRHANTLKVFKTIDYNIGKGIRKPGFITFSKKQDRMATVDTDHLRVWDYRIIRNTQDEILDLDLHVVMERFTGQRGQWVDFDHTERYVFWLQSPGRGHGQQLNALDLETGELLPFSQDVSIAFNSVAMIPNSSYVAFVSRSDNHSYIQVWDYLENQAISNYEEDLRCQRFSPPGLAASPDGRYLAFASNELTKLKIYDLHQQQLLAALPTEQNSTVFFCTWSPDGNHLATLGPNGKVETWHLQEVRQRLAEIGLDWED